jgi:exodeoxyribonuclease VIII
MAEAVHAHPAARALLSAPGEAELSAYWMEPIVDPETGEVVDEILCRCRPDFWRYDGILVDLKSTKGDVGADLESFARSVWNFRYYVQHPMYLDGSTKALAHAQAESDDFEMFARPRKFVFIACENDACVVDGKAKGVAVYELDEESVALGRLHMQEDLATLSECRRSGEFPGYSERIERIALPSFAFTRA